MGRHWQELERKAALDGLKVPEREFLKRASALLAAKLDSEQKKLAKDFQITAPEIDEMLTVYRGGDHTRGLRELFDGQQTIYDEQDLRLTPDDMPKKGKRKRGIGAKLVDREVVVHPAGPIPQRRRLPPGEVRE